MQKQGAIDLSKNLSMGRTWHLFMNVYATRPKQTKTDTSDMG